MIGCHGTDLSYGDPVVSHHTDIRPDAPDHLNQVIRKAVIIINQKDHISSASPAYMIACITAPALFSDSSYSRSGTLSATIPPPA